MKRKEKKLNGVLHKDATCCFEQILEAAPNKTEVVRLLPSLLRNHPNNPSKTSWALLVKVWTYS